MTNDVADKVAHHDISLPKKKKKKKHCSHKHMQGDRTMIQKGSQFKSSHFWFLLNHYSQYCSTTHSLLIFIRDCLN